MSPDRRARLAALTVAALALVLATSTTAEACSCRTREYGRFFLGADGRLPPDAVGIPWHGPSLAPLEKGAPPRVTSFERHAGEQRIPAAFTIRSDRGIEFIVPDGGLVPGDSFTVTVPATRDGSSMITTTVTVGPAPIALDGATLVLSPRRRGTVALRPEESMGQCSDDVDADLVVATVKLPPTVEPYREYLLYTTLVDDKPYVTAPASLCARARPRLGRSQRGETGTDELFTICDGEAGLVPGPHTVAVRIETPDGRSLTTPAQTFELDCATSPLPVPPPPEPAQTPPPEPAASGPPPVTRGCTVAAPSLPTWPPVLLLLARRRRSAHHEDRRPPGPQIPSAHSSRRDGDRPLPEVLPAPPSSGTSLGD